MAALWSRRLAGHHLIASSNPAPARFVALPGMPFPSYGSLRIHYVVGLLFSEPDVPVPYLPLEKIGRLGLGNKMFARANSRAQVRGWLALSRAESHSA